MEMIQDLAIVLKSIRYQERHLIVTAITEHHGMVSAIARNSIQSRRFGGALDLFAASDWTFRLRSNANLYQVTEASTRHAFTALQKDFHKLAVASALSEYLLLLAPENEDCQDLFKLHSNALWTLQETAVSQQTGQVPYSVAFLNIYLIKLLQWSGHQPLLDTCIKCGKTLSSIPLDSACNGIVENGGWICGSCIDQGSGAQAFLLDPRSLQEVQLGLSQSLRHTLKDVQGSQQNHRRLFDFLQAFFIFHIPRFDQNQIKSLKFCLT